MSKILHSGRILPLFRRLVNVRRFGAISFGVLARLCSAFWRIFVRRFDPIPFGVLADSTRLDFTPYGWWNCYVFLRVRMIAQYLSQTRQPRTDALQDAANDFAAVVCVAARAPSAKEREDKPED